MSGSARDDFALLRLLQLASPALPIGSYAYSQGLEWAVGTGWVTDARSASEWLAEQLTHSFARVDLPIFARLYDSAQRGDSSAMLAWSRRLMASRESSELVADDNARGRALARLLRDLGIPEAAAWVDREDAPLAALTALASIAWEIPLATAAFGFTWSWLEGQVMATVKLVPLGQVAGQRMLLELSNRIPAAWSAARACNGDDIGATLPILAIASSLHETQYTRLFRS
jgi:urease accessory protein